jgi:hypothetical protein
VIFVTVGRGRALPHAVFALVARPVADLTQVYDLETVSGAGSLVLMHERSGTPHYGFSH